MNTERTERKIEIIIDSNLEDVVLVGTVTKTLCSHLPMSNVECENIELSVCEAVNNAVIHAYGNRGGHQVMIAFTIKTDKLVIDVCDQGKKMTELGSPCVIFNTEDRRCLPESGVGLFIIEQLMDEVVYRTKEGTNILTMTRRIEPDCPAE